MKTDWSQSLQLQSLYCRRQPRGHRLYWRLCTISQKGLIWELSSLQILANQQEVILSSSQRVAIAIQLRKNLESTFSQIEWLISGTLRLPGDVVCAPSVNSFKSKLDNRLLLVSRDPQLWIFINVILESLCFSRFPDWLIPFYQIQAHTSHDS